jgi:hypothetical protein
VLDALRARAAAAHHCSLKAAGERPAPCISVKKHPIASPAQFSSLQRPIQPLAAAQQPISDPLLLCLQGEPGNNYCDALCAEAVVRNKSYEKLTSFCKTE